MSVGTRLPLARAEAVALAIVDVLRPGCERIEIAGSIRRRKPDVGDIEILALPRMAQGMPLSLIEDPPLVSALDPIIARLDAEGRFAPHPDKPPKNGERYKMRWLPKAGLQLDLFLVLPPAEWGALFTIRTGPADFSERLVTRLKRKGWRCTDGHVIDQHGERVSCPEERDFFAACGVEWIEPEARR